MIPFLVLQHMKSISSMEGFNMREEKEPTRRQNLITAITMAIKDLASAVWVATTNDEYTDEQLADYMQQIAEMHLIKRRK